MQHLKKTGLISGLALMLPALAVPGTIGWPGTAAVAAGQTCAPEACTPAKPMFAISVDGEHVGGTPGPQDLQRLADRRLAAVDIQIKSDGLDMKPFLNVSTNPVRHAYRSGERVVFYTSTNYSSWIERAEIRIFDPDGLGGPNPVATLPAVLNADTAWIIPAEGAKAYAYALRVYDAKGNFDETAREKLVRTERETQTGIAASAPGYGEDRTAVRNISLAGAAITVFGRNVPQGRTVRFDGRQVPVDKNGAFVSQTILPAGEHDIHVTVGDTDIIRTVNIPKSDWFYVALADLTIGHRSGSPGFEAVRPGEFPGMYKAGRLAFYLKGKVKGKYLLTAAGDTGTGDLASIFRGLDRKDAKSLLSRLDPDDYYAVYGDDSTSEEDAPTRGKFYVRLENGDSHVLWGNFRTSINESEFLRQERALYGTQAIYRSPSTTTFGARRIELNTFAAQPGTLPHRDIFRATGGSVYFLRHQDITQGSESVSVEISDPVTGVVLERRQLVNVTDYEIDSIQGVVVLKRPLSSVTGTDGAVINGNLAGNHVNLVVQYEFTPAVGDVDGYTLGGRAQTWVDDHVRVGVTAMSETTGTADQVAGSADVRVRLSERTYVDAEYAVSKGPGFGTALSKDGGISISDETTTGIAGVAAKAWRINSHADLADISGGAAKGTLSAYYQDQEKGFSTLAKNVGVDSRSLGARMDLELSEDVKLALAYDDYADADSKRKRVGKSEISYDYSENWSMLLGLNHTLSVDPTATTAGYNGSRSDVGARLRYHENDDRLYYAFVQATVARTGDLRRNDRGGVGAEIRLTDKLGLNGEISYGTSGLGGLASLSYEPNVDDHYYFGYRLDPDRIFDPAAGYSDWGTDRGALVFGSRRKIDDIWTVYAENSYDLFSKRRSLTQSYGVNYTPDALWTANAAAEIGRINDDTIDTVTGLKRADFDRRAFSLSTSFNDEERKLQARLKGEVRTERSDDHSRDLNAYLASAKLSWQQKPDWRTVASLDVAISDKLTTSQLDGTYIEGSLGYAYRPVSNDRLNLLLKYSYLYDLPGPDQVNANGELNGPAQRSHIFSIDGIYDITPKLSLGAKYGARIGEERTRNATEWSRNDAQLAVLRADLHVVSAWDVTLEGRALWSMSSATVDWGALAAIYRHVGDNFKLGVGYNFGRFSDDLRDLTLDDRGVFFNVVGKF